MSLVTSPSAVFTAALVVFGMVTTYLAVFSNRVLIRPYMDEIFHISQVQKYCQGHYYQWDPKITTPPGLYLLTLGLLKPLASFWPQTFTCNSLAVLRSINVVFTLGNVYLFFAILNRLNGSSLRPVRYFNLISALNLGLFPPLYFFTFLYYTDVGSTFAVLLAYLLALRRSHAVAAVISVVAVLFRQTNVVWVAFLGLLAVTQVLEDLVGKTLHRVDRSSLAYLEVLVRSALELLCNRRKPGRRVLIQTLITHCGGYLVVGVGFAVFVLWNDGIALGDRHAHPATVHVPQLFYFAVFTLFFAGPHLLSREHSAHFGHFVRRRRVQVASVAVVLAAVVALNTVVHPYVLADNRHYIFYIWRWFLGRHLAVRFLLIPAYLYAGHALLAALLRSRGLVWTACFCACLVANLVPQGLMEPRYFIVPFLLLRSNLSPPVRVQWSALVAELVLYVAINSYALNLFLMRPFASADADVLQRFMW